MSLKCTTFSATVYASTVLASRWAALIKSAQIVHRACVQSVSSIKCFPVPVHACNVHALFKSLSPTIRLASSVSAGDMCAQASMRRSLNDHPECATFPPKRRAGCWHSMLAFDKNRGNMSRLKVIQISLTGGIASDSTHSNWSILADRAMGHK